MSDDEFLALAREALPELQQKYHINTQTQLAARGGQQAPHYYLFGHFHKSLEIPHGLGEVVVNGNFVGADNYSLASNFVPVDPAQTLFEVHPKYGRTGIYPLKLQHAKPGQGAHYLEALHLNVEDSDE